MARQPRRFRVLVVDDNRDAAETLALLLRTDGHDARVAHDGPGALPGGGGVSGREAVVLDIGLPGMDGYEVARRLASWGPASAGVLLVAL